MTKIVHSFWSAPYDSKSVEELILCLKGNWFSAKHHLMCWMLSCLQFRKLYGGIELVTDRLGESLLVEELKLPYSSVNTDLDRIVIPNPSVLWSFGKVVAFSKQSEPFIHADGDFIPWRRFPKRIESADLVAQSPDVDVPMYAPVMNEVLSTFNFIPECFERRPPYLSSNAGIIGGQRTDLFQELVDLVEAFILKNQGCLDIKNSEGLFLLIEQYYFHHLAKERGLKIEYLYKRLELDSFRTISFNEIPHFEGYIHLMAGYKGKANLCYQVERLLYNFYPKQYDRVCALFPEELPATKATETQKRIQRIHDGNIIKWFRSSRKNILKLRLLLAFHSSIKESEGRRLLSFFSLVTMREHEIELKEWEVLIGFFSQPRSIADFLSFVCEHYDVSVADQKRLEVVVLKTLASYLIYFCVLEIVD